MLCVYAHACVWVCMACPAENYKYAVGRGSSSIFFGQCSQKVELRVSHDIALHTLEDTSMVHAKA